MNIGIDIVENKRLKDKNIDFVKKILTIKEIELMNKKTGRQKLEFLSGRFTLKEAIKKTLKERVDFNEIEILYDEDSKPIAKYKDYNFSVSISHEENYTVAIAILLK